MRIEKDLLGTCSIPKDVYWGVYTQRAIENFPLSGLLVHREIIYAIATVKKAAAEINAELGYVQPRIAQAICQAADEVIAGAFDSQFPLDGLQGGAGTSTNMNVNEVLANRANELLGHPLGSYEEVHPLNDVNCGQSTNDVYPTAIKVAALQLLEVLASNCAQLQEILQDKEAEFAAVIKVGRTEMQDAVPILLGQEFSAYAQAISRDRWRLYKVEERLRQVNLGGTAVGTGLNADKRYIYKVIDKVRNYTKTNLARSENMIDATQNADVFVEVSGLLKALAANLIKISNDLRLMSSGPRAGLGEISLPEMQAGSSIMPGKVNPVIAEAIAQIGYEVVASDLAITMGVQAGQLELNAFLPLIGHHIVHSIKILSAGTKIFAEKCVAGITPNIERCQTLLDQSLTTAAVLVPRLGYDAATVIAREALHSGRSIREIVIDEGYLEASELNELLNPQKMTRPGIANSWR